MYADIPATIRLRTTNGCVNIPHVGMVTTSERSIDLTLVHGPRRKQVWGYIQRCLHLNLVVRAGVSVVETPVVDTPVVPVTTPVVETPVVETPVVEVTVPIVETPVVESVPAVEQPLPPAKPSRKKSSLF